MNEAIQLATKASNVRQGAKSINIATKAFAGSAMLELVQRRDEADHALGAR